MLECYPWCPFECILLWWSESGSSYYKDNFVVKETTVSPCIQVGNNYPILIAEDRRGLMFAVLKKHSTQQQTATLN